MAVDSVNDLCVPFTEHFEQSARILQCVNGVSLVRRFDRIFKPIGDAWICKDFVESHIQGFSRWCFEVLRIPGEFLVHTAIASSILRL
jgi:hypothetical protein